MSVPFRARAGIAGLALLGAAMSGIWMRDSAMADTDGKPCIRNGGGRPLLVGDTMTLAIGVTHDSSCDPAPSRGFRWTTVDSLTVHVETSGRVRGLRPGDFEAVAIGTDTTLRYSGGFVLPKGWRLVTTPAMATAFVGDSVRFTDFATDSLGNPFPAEWFSRNRYFGSRWVHAEEPVPTAADKVVGGQLTRALLIVPGGRPGGTVQLFTRFTAPRYRTDLIALPTDVADSLRRMAFDLLKSSTYTVTTDDPLREYRSTLHGQRLVITPERPVTITTMTREVTIAQLVVVIPAPGESPRFFAMKDGGWTDAYLGYDVAIVKRMQAITQPFFR